MLTQTNPLAEQRVVRYDIDWVTFETILAAVGDRRPTLPLK
ncbi:hypothetical protein [Anthocerotibacter panamensis]|nr:hypothetical protein [Anthocerotibacter panamensis]